RLCDEIGLAMITTRGTAAIRHVTKSHTAKLAPRDVEAVVEKAILRQFDRMDVHDAEHCAAPDRQDRVRYGITGRADRFLLGSGSVKNAVDNAQGDWLVLDLVFVNLNRAEDAVLD